MKKFFIILIVVTPILLGVILIKESLLEMPESEKKLQTQPPFWVTPPQNWKLANKEIPWLTSGGFGLMFCPPEGDAVLIVSKSKELELGEKHLSLDEFVATLLRPFEGDKNFKKVDDSNISLDKILARDITFEYREEEKDIKVRFVISEKYKGDFYKIALTTPKPSFDKYISTFEEVLKSVKFN